MSGTVRVLVSFDVRWVWFIIGIPTGPGRNVSLSTQAAGGPSEVSYCRSRTIGNSSVSDHVRPSDQPTIGFDAVQQNIAFVTAVKFRPGRLVR